MEIIDNTSKLWGDAMKRDLKKGSRVKIAASTFSIYAYEALKDELEKIESLQFIFTTPSFVAQEVTDKVRKEQREFFIPKPSAESQVHGTDFEIRLRNKLDQKAIAKECADWIRRKAKFKSNLTNNPMQGLACLSNSNQAAVYSPVNGFSVPDLGYEPSNAHYTMMNRLEDQTFTEQYMAKFNEIWNNPDKVEDVTNSICSYIESVYQENSPERIYFLILYNIFNEYLEQLDQDNLPNDLTGYQDTLVWNKLFDFQKDGASGIINKLEIYNGCILADSVGLGKTFTALAVIKYYELRNRSVLVLCPKKLADNWLNYNKNLTTNPFAADRFNYDVLCHTDLSRNSGESLGIPLDKVNWGNYDLVVVDESHNFRNNEVNEDKETRYQRLMNRIIRDGVKTKVLMLSATPVNNRFKDLRNQLALAYEGQSHLLSKKLKSKIGVEQIFSNAQRAFNDWSKMEAELRTPEAILNALDFDFFELLDAVTIARSRKQIQNFYDTSAIGKFPKRLPPKSERCAITNRTDVKPMNALAEQLSKLTLAIYMPVTYILPSRLAKYEEMYDSQTGEGKGKLSQVTREKGLQALNTTNLLKRLESSVHSFRLTLGGLAAKMEQALDAIEAFEESGAAMALDKSVTDFDDLAFDDEIYDGVDEFTIGTKIKINLADMDVKSWKRELQNDKFFVDDLMADMSLVSPQDDLKLQHLIQHVKDKVANPLNPGNKKVIIFTAFADTADYLFKHLSPVFKTELGLDTGKITGSDNNPPTTLGKSFGLQQVLTLFSPISKNKQAVMPNEPGELDILIATDCISEGQNLQDCDYLINYDIHWNPVRVIQRFGRVDRIGSPNEQIQLVNYWPDITLDDYINLKERVENRMVATNLSATGDDNVLSDKSTDIEYRRDQLKKLQNEVIELEDVKTGVSITDLGLNDFRMDLVAYLADHPEIKKLPKGLHAVVPTDRERGLEPGVIFALRNIHDSVNVDQQNRLHPYYLVYMAQDGRVVADQRDVKRLLDLVRVSCKGRHEPIERICALYNQATGDGRQMQEYSELLNQAIASMIEVKDESDIDSLFSGGGTSALVNTIAGLDDFELIAFLAIQDDGD